MWSGRGCALSIWGSGGLPPEKKKQFCAKNYAILSKFWYFFPILQHKNFPRIRESGGLSPSPKSGGSIPLSSLLRRLLFRAAINRRCTRRPPVTACSMLTVLLANSSTCKFYCCYLYCRIPLLAKSTAYITLNFHYLQIQPLLPLLLTSISCKFNPLYCQNQLLANSAPPFYFRTAPNTQKNLHRG